jgi:hypothetical protein
VTDSSHSSARGFFEDLQSAVQANPLPAALIGMGALWMLMGGGRTTAAAALVSGGAARAAEALAPVARSVATGAGAIAEGVSNAASSATNAVAETLGSATDGANTATDRVASSAHDAQRALRDATGKVAQSGTAFANSAQANLAETFERQPLLVGVIGLAIGAAIATAFPTTRLEEEYVGETAAKVTKKFQTIAKQQGEALQKTASRTLDAVKDEAAAQGLTPDALKKGAATAATAATAAPAASGARRNGGPGRA